MLLQAENAYVNDDINASSARLFEDNDGWKDSAVTAISPSDLQDLQLRLQARHVISAGAETCACCVAFSDLTAGPLHAHGGMRRGCAKPSSAATAMNDRLPPSPQVWEWRPGLSGGSVLIGESRVRVDGQMERDRSACAHPQPLDVQDCQ